jgi:hypothetical protein
MRDPPPDRVTDAIRQRSKRPVRLRQQSRAVDTEKTLQQGARIAARRLYAGIR